MTRAMGSEFGEYVGTAMKYFSSHGQNTSENEREFKKALSGFALHVNKLVETGEAKNVKAASLDAMELLADATSRSNGHLADVSKVKDAFKQVAYALREVKNKEDYKGLNHFSETRYNTAELIKSLNNLEVEYKDVVELGKAFDEVEEKLHGSWVIESIMGHMNKH